MPKAAATCRASLPSREAWIEITPYIAAITGAALSLPSREAWIEMQLVADFVAGQRSLPSREAWIEINRNCMNVDFPNVASLAGSVD